MLISRTLLKSLKQQQSHLLSISVRNKEFNQDASIDLTRHKNSAQEEEKVYVYNYLLIFTAYN